MIPREIIFWGNVTELQSSEARNLSHFFYNGLSLKPWSIPYWLGKATAVPKCHSCWLAAAGLAADRAKWHRLQRYQVTAALSVSSLNTQSLVLEGQEGGSRSCQTPNTHLNGGRPSPPSESSGGQWLPRESITLRIQGPLKSKPVSEFEITHKWDIFNRYSIQNVVRFPWLFHLALGSGPVTVHQSSEHWSLWSGERQEQRRYKSAGLPRKGGADQPCSCHRLRGGVTVKMDAEDVGSHSLN